MAQLTAHSSQPPPLSSRAFLGLTPVRKYERACLKLEERKLYDIKFCFFFFFFLLDKVRVILITKIFKKCKIYFLNTYLIK